jgi:hypothetical protein
MQRVRGLVPVVALVLLAGGALAGCRSQPTVAAYVGSDKITEKRVGDIVADFEKRTRPSAAPGATEAPASPQPLPRTAVVTTLVVSTLCNKLREEKHFTTKPTTPAQIVEGTAVPADTEYVKILAEMLTCLSGLETPGTAPTEEALRGLYDSAAAAGAVDTQAQPFDKIKGSLAQDPTIQQKGAAQRALAEGSQVADVSVNPRYRPLEYTIILQQGVYFTVPLGQPGLDAVTPAPSEAPNPNASDAPMAPPQ